MDSLAALLIVVFQLFFGWCGDGHRPAPEPAPAENSAGR
jgi:hypothetical protein